MPKLVQGVPMPIWYFQWMPLWLVVVIAKTEQVITRLLFQLIGRETTLVNIGTRETFLVDGQPVDAVVTEMTLAYVVITTHDGREIKLDSGEVEVARRN